MEVDSVGNLTFCVVTPNFNMARYLPETMESVIANLRPGDRYYVIDGGSSDGSRQVLEKYAGRISGWISETDRGYADAVAKGFAMANTDMQCWLACGDLMLPGALDLARSVMADTGAEMIFGDDFYIDEQSNVIQLTRGNVPDLAATMLYGSWTPLQDACYWRSSLYRTVGGLNVDVRYAADYDLFLRMSLTGRCVYTPHVFSAFRRHDGQTSQRYQERYRLEKESCRQAAMRGMRWRRSGIARMYYWLYPRVRARLGYSGTLASSWRGSPVLQHRACASATLERAS
jgi:glycosyltransferase involved in cell wall biosynthesis